MIGAEGGKNTITGFWERREAQDTESPSRAHTSRRVGRYYAGKEALPIMKLNRSLTDQVFGIGRYMYSKDGQLYFIHGKNRIKVTEHFSCDGKPINLLLEDLIQFSAKQQDDNSVRPVKE